MRKLQDKGVHSTFPSLAPSPTSKTTQSNPKKHQLKPPFPPENHTLKSHNHPTSTRKQPFSTPKNHPVKPQNPPTSTRKPPLPLQKHAPPIKITPLPLIKNHTPNKKYARSCRISPPTPSFYIKEVLTHIKKTMTPQRLRPSVSKYGKKNAHQSLFFYTYSHIIIILCTVQTRERERERERESAFMCVCKYVFPSVRT